LKSAAKVRLSLDLRTFNPDYQIGRADPARSRAAVRIAD